MPPPDDLYTRFHCREQTYMRGGKPDRRHYERIRRSFFKFVCKQQLYWPLFVHERGWHFRAPSPHIESYSYSGTFPRCGYPTFRSWNSETYRHWGLEFRKHRETWKAPFYEQFKRRAEADTRELLHGSGVSEVFQILAAPGAFQSP